MQEILGDQIGVDMLFYVVLYSSLFCACWPSDFLADVEQECAKHGNVVRVFIPEGNGSQPCEGKVSSLPSLHLQLTVDEVPTTYRRPTVSTMIHNYGNGHRKGTGTVAGTGREWVRQRERKREREGSGAGNGSRNGKGMGAATGTEERTGRKRGREWKQEREGNGCGNGNGRENGKEAGPGMEAGTGVGVGADFLSSTLMRLATILSLVVHSCCGSGSQRPCSLASTQVCVEYESAESCEKAVSALMGRTFNNRTVITSYYPHYLQPDDC